MYILEVYGENYNALQESLLTYLSSEMCRCGLFPIVILLFNYCKNLYQPIDVFLFYIKHDDVTTF